MATMICEVYYQRPYQAMSTTESSSRFDLTDEQYRARMAFFEEAARVGNCKRIENSREIRFDKHIDCERFSSIIFPKEEV